MKEVWATQVLIPFGIVRADACCFNTDLQGRQSRIFGYGEHACELIEPSPYMPYHKMLRDELGKGVYRIKRIHPWERASVPLKMRDVVLVSLIASSLRYCKTKESPANTHLLFESQTGYEVRVCWRPER